MLLATRSAVSGAPAPVTDWIVSMTKEAITSHTRVSGALRVSAVHASPAGTNSTTFNSHSLLAGSTTRRNSHPSRHHPRRSPSGIESRLGPSPRSNSAPWRTARVMTTISNREARATNVPSHEVPIRWPSGPATMAAAIAPSTVQSSRLLFAICEMTLLTGATVPVGQPQAVDPPSIT